MKDMKLTKGMKNFLFKDVLPNYIIYSKKLKQAYCTACQSDVEINYNEATHKLETTCPKCKAKAFYKSEQYIRGAFEDFGCGIFYTKEDDAIAIHHVSVKKIYDRFGTVRDFWYEEVLREYYNKNGWVKGFDKVYFGWKKLNIRKYDNYKGAAGEPCYHILFHWHYTNTYKRNIKSVIKGTPREHSCLDKIYKLEDIHHYYDVPRVFLRDYLTCPLAEYLYKVGFYDLCQYMVFSGSLKVDPKKKTLPDILKVDKENYKALLNVGNPSREELRKRQRMSQYKLSESEWKIFDKYFEDLSSYRMDFGGSRYEELIQYYKKTLYQLDKYIQTEPKFSLNGYIDHLKMCNDLGDDLNSTFVLYPKDFEKAHQEVINRWNATKKERDIAKAKERNAEYEAYKVQYTAMYSFEEDNFKVIVPNGCDDICREGQNLHHCVGTYVDKVCKGTSVILFIRDLANVTKSFYTLELQGNKMIQCRGQNNKNMTPEVQKFIDDFAKQKNLIATQYMGGVA